MAFESLERRHALQVATTRTVVSGAGADGAIGPGSADGEPLDRTAAVKIGRYDLIEQVGAGGMGAVWKAFDPELNRGVALKLASAGDAKARQRARDEGRALARLSHPNVVPIHDVVEHETGVFLVMELVKGRTLRELATETSPLDLVRAYRQAGVGLAAAHDVGLVHRDFKPDNAIMGTDQRVRVLDFGLAHDVASAPRDVAGTPRYMAPEQRSGSDSLTPAADQYSFCVALREGIASSGQPLRWLQPILARGSSERPIDRYPSMNALLDELALDPATRWRRRSVAALAVASLAAGVGAFTVGRSQQEESPCEGGADVIAPSWGLARRAEIKTRLEGLSTKYTAEAVPRITTALDAYAADWVQLHKSSCRAHRRGEISADLLDRRSGCLSTRRAALEAITDLAATVPADGLPGVVSAIGTLPEVGACDDDQALMAGVEPPPAGAAAQAKSIADDIARIDVEREAGRFEDATRRADDVVARTDALAYRPLLARARLARARILQNTVKGDRGAADLRAAVHDALVAGDLPVAIESYGRLAYAIGTTGDLENATEGVGLIEALSEGSDPQLRLARMILHRSLGAVAMSRGDRPAARALYERVRAEASQLHGVGGIDRTQALRGLVLLTDDEAARGVVAAELIARRAELLGAQHPLALDAKILAAAMNPEPEAARTQLGEPCLELARIHPGMGSHISECAFEVVWLAWAAGDKAQARRFAELVAASADKGAEPEVVHLALGYHQLLDGDTNAATATFAAIAKPGDETASWWWKRYIAAEGRLGTAFVLIATHRGDEARLALKRALELYDQTSMPPPILARRRHVIERLMQR